MYDVLVIGGGHAGCEAASAAARRGARVCLASFRPQDIGQMSCNPSIGGVGKGHLVRELDVFDGLMARAADRAAIHRRMLNRSKGSAVHGPRIQADRRLFQHAVNDLLDESGVEHLACEIVRMVIEAGRIVGVETSEGQKIACRALVIATGTFLDARIFCGEERIAGGRTGERAAVPLADQVREIGLGQGRLKTGTPPRLEGTTIDWARLAVQPSDDDGWTMSALDDGVSQPQLACAIARTNDRTHDLIRSGFDRSPLFAGAIEGRGPRYCPSIEDKVRRFGDRDGHQIFLEPEGLDSALVYPNGISTSLPADLQLEFVRSIAGLERCDIVRPGYAVEYEYADARRLGSTLESRDIPGLFLAGQINGTTGYEEAAAQGLVAGLNAAAAALDMAMVPFDRRTSYIGVMIDDLTLQGVSEPYRMMTARAEYRLALRADNAVTRLGQDALAAECVSGRRRQSIEAHFASGPGRDEAATDAIYAPYIDRQRREWAAVERDRGATIPADLDFAEIAGLAIEMVERLSVARPETIDQASGVGNYARRIDRAPRGIGARGGMIDRLAEVSGRHVSRETFAQLSRYIDLLTAANVEQNLVAASTIDDVWERHIVDSAQLVRFEPKVGASWVDVGSGAGLPGLVVAIMTEGPMTLVEPRRLRVDFLTSVIDDLGLSGRVAVVQGKADKASGKYDVIAARAVAPVDRLLGITLHLSHRGTIWLLPKGRSGKSDLADATRTWQGVFRSENSLTDPEATIVIASGVHVKGRR